MYNPGRATPQSCSSLQAGGGASTQASALATSSASRFDPVDEEAQGDLQEQSVCLLRNFFFSKTADS